MYNKDENEVLRDALSSLNKEVPPMPEGLHAAWMQKVEEDMENKQTPKFQIPKTVTRWLSTAAALVFIIGGTLLTKDNLSLDNATRSNGAMTYSTSSVSYKYAAEESYDYDYDTPTDGVMLMAARGASNSMTEAAPVLAEKKIIRTASMTIQTKTFEDSLNALKSTCVGQGGWIESSSENVNSYTGLRTAYLTLRVPQTGLDAYLAGTEGLGRITSHSESADDVTETYQDTATRLATQQALMARLQALITESADLSDLLALESQIADTQYQIDRLQSSLNTTDRQVNYSTVHVTLQEEKNVPLTETTVSFGDRIISAIEMGFEALVEFLQDMVIFLVAALPFIAIVGAVVIVVKIIRRKKK